MAMMLELRGAVGILRIWEHQLESYAKLHAERRR
jgi:hypothetical protein